MGILSRAGDLVYTFRFLKLLVTPFKETNAYKFGIIDDKGKRIKSKKNLTSEEKSAYTAFNRLVFNIKRLMEKVPGGSSKIASYAAALYLVKENLDLTDQAIETPIEKAGIDITIELEEQSQWFLTNDKMLSPGVYRINVDDKLTSQQLEQNVRKGDKIRVMQECYPIDQICGIDIYEVQHMQTNQTMYVTTNELIK